MYRKTFPLFIIFFSVLNQGFSISPVAIYDSLYEIHISQDKKEIIEDKNNLLSLKDVADSSFSSFRPISEFKLDEYRDTYYWIRFEVVNHSSEDYKWILQAPLHTQYIEVYFVLSDGKVLNYRTGQDFEFLSRDYEVRSLAFSLPQIRNQKYKVYIKIHNRTHTDLHFIITDQKPYTRVLVGGYIFHGVIYGILLLIALYNFILFLSLKNRVYIYYVLYIVCSGFFISWKDGLAFQYIWPSHPEINSYHHKISIFLLVMTFALYASEFFELRNKYRKLYLFLIALVALNSLLFIFRVNKKAFFDAFPIDYLLTFTFIFGLSLYFLLKGILSTRYFILGSSFMLVALVILKLRYLKLMEWSPFVEHSLNYALVVEAAAMSFALRDKLALLRRQKEMAQAKLIAEMKDREQAQFKLIDQMEINEKLKDKVNRELQKKVSERTAELDEKVKELNIANEKLAQSYHELGELGKKLDIDNWNLKKDIKKERQSRINAERVSFHKFKELFPDGNSCLRFLYVRKWSEDGTGYKCKKCGNKKSFDLNNIKYAKKCTKCNYIETVTANTLFHRMKFDLNKAYYIAYVSVIDPEYPAARLAEAIELRKNTGWKFYKKVEEKIELYKKDNKVKKVPAWEVLIMDERKE